MESTTGKDKFLDLYALLFVASASAQAQMRLGEYGKAEETLKNALASGWRAAGEDRERFMRRVGELDEKFLDNRGSR